MATKFPPGWNNRGTLGEGGQCRVFLATRDGDDTKQYALKVLRNNLPETAYERFRREIGAIKQIDHPGIVRVIEYSESSQKPPFYAMEYEDRAKSLRQLMRSGGNPFRTATAAIAFFIQLTEAIRCYSEKGIVHRDLSPANILAMPDRSIKIIDFGLCQHEGREPVTLADENVGTPNYMAPECESLSATPVTVKSDLYSAGKILWSAVSNLNAFGRESAVFRERSMKSMFPEEPSLWHLQRVFDKTIRHNPADRWESAEVALIEAKRIRGVIERGLLPVEAIHEGHCPICGIGRLVDPSKAIPVGGYALFGQSHPDGVVKKVCAHCGFCALWYRPVQQHSVDRQGFE